MIKCALQTNTIQIKHNKVRIPTGGRLSSWLFTWRGGVEFGATEDKFIQWQGGGLELGTSGLQVQRPTTRPRSPPSKDESGRKYLLLWRTLRGKKLFISSYCYSLTDGNSFLYATVITLSCMLFVLLVVIGVLVWRLRRALPNNASSTEDRSITDDVGQGVSPRDQHMSEQGSYLELRPRALEGQSPEPPEYKSLQSEDENTEYYNVGFNEGKDDQEEIYHEIGNA